MKRLILTVMFALPLIAGCSKSNAGEAEKPVSSARHDIVLTKSQTELIKVGNTFAFKLLGDVAASLEGSFMISPLSVQYALSMLSNGASGATQDELLRLLGFGKDRLSEANELCKYLVAELLGADNTVEMSLANALIYNTFYSGGFGLKQSYVNGLVNWYDAYVKGYDFNAENAKAISGINSWASEQTRGMIPEIMNRLDPSVYLLLMNAIYFKGNWNSSLEFKSAATRQEDFTLESGRKVRLPIMRTECMLAYAGTDVCDIVRLPYGNGAFAMNVLLPAEGKTISDVIEWLKSGKSYWLSSFQVKLKLPKFETENTIGLRRILAPYIPSSFSDMADFSAMTDAPVCVSDIFQKAKIKVNEQGTESSAVTVIVLGPTSAGPDVDIKPQVIEFYATRPFVYVISEISTGAVLFSGVYKGE